MKTANKKSAFTLMELMLAALASAILLLTAATIAVTALQTWRKNNAYISLRRDAAFAIELMARDIREARPSGLIATGTDTLAVSNYVRGYVSGFTLNPATKVISGFRNGIRKIPFVAGNVGVFRTSLPSGRMVRLHLEMMNIGIGITITNETDISMRN